ncbi:PPE domain-containing protein [Aldersonia kunmingensis]|uniref:PPE domain-containing protein n=1 Tax=Aldersonia kunmingensis TaxID=408066 RepID=UPI000836597D|nr:PPE domain-containing protein [Aldersonia kunmingensis]
MTLGVTGVFWLPRMATANSTTLSAGAHAIPISGASAAWTAIAGAYADATFTVARVVAELGVGMQGLNGVVAAAKLVGFGVWAERGAENAAIMAAKTGANATAYTVASVAMPSLPEIIAVKTAKTAAYTTGGVLNGTAEAAEVADRAMDIRAAIVMEAYEAATTTTVLTPSVFAPAPSIAAGVDGAEAQSGGDADALQVLLGGDPVRAASMAVTGLLQNPGVQTIAAQAGNIASTAASVGGNIGGAAVSAVTGNAHAMLGGSVAPMGSLGGFGGIGGAASSGAVATRAAGVGELAGARMTGVALPEGWAGGALGGTSASVGTTGLTGPNVEAGQQNFTGGRVDPAATRTAGMGHLAGPRAASDDETEHDSPEYLRNVEHFEDGRMVVPSVLGADPTQ